jgi:hypothetical protein
MKTYSLEEMTDKHIGKKGTSRRDAFEEELRLDILGQTIKNIRKKRHLTQSELGLTCYGSNKEGVKRKIPNAVLISEELGKRFPGRAKTKREE